jgi:hypothetical protein
MFARCYFRRNFCGSAVNPGHRVNASSDSSLTMSAYSPFNTRCWPSRMVCYKKEQGAFKSAADGVAARRKIRILRAVRREKQTRREILWRLRRAHAVKAGQTV